MDKSKIIYLAFIATIVILLLFIGDSISHRLTDPEPAELATIVQNGKLLVADSRSIISFSLANYEDSPTNYTIRTIIGNYSDNFTHLLNASERLTQSITIPSGTISDLNYTIEIYRENESKPIDSSTYILR